MKLDYLQKNRNSFIRMLLILMVAFAGWTNLLAIQTFTVTGTVTDKTDGSSLIGVNVTVKGTTTGTITDLDGKYKIDVSSENAVLVFTYVG